MKSAWIVRLSLAATFVWLVAAVPVLSVYHGGIRPFFSPDRHGNQDFAQYYMGAMVLRHGPMEALYPRPKPGDAQNPGWPGSSTMHPAYEELARRAGVGDAHRFVHPPPMALVVGPLAFLPYPIALWVWSMLMGLCAWGTCVMAARLHAHLRPSHPPSARAVLILLAGCSPLMVKALRVANVTPAVSLAFGAGLCALVTQSRDFRGAAGIVGAGLGKGIGALLLPLALLQHRWRLLWWTVVLSAALLLMAWGFMGARPFLDFFSVILPALQRPDPFDGNQSIYGAFFRAHAGAPLAPALLTTVKGTGLLLHLAAVGLLISKRKAVRTSTPHLLAGAALLTSLSLLFSPFTWDHYTLYLVPLWAWLFYEASSARLLRIAVIAALALTWCPLAAIREGALLPWVPARSHMLLGYVLVAVIAAHRLLRPFPAPAPDPPASRAA